MFRHIFVVSNARSSLLQTAYYGAYFNARDPRVLHHRRFGYKTGVLTGLGVAAVGGACAENLIRPGGSSYSVSAEAA